MVHFCVVRTAPGNGCGKSGDVEPGLDPCSVLRWNRRMPDAAPGPSTPARLASLDTYRGFVMFLMAAELLHLTAIARHFPESGFWQFLKTHSEHVEWTGWSLHDLIQPSFSFMVGVALPFSIASRE